MISTVQRATLLTDDDARFLVEALDAMALQLRKHGYEPSARVKTLTIKLRKSVENASDSGGEHQKHASDQRLPWFSDQTSAYAITSPNEAARILGISANGVRDLARRGVLPARRSGGRWFISTTGVMARAEKYPRGWGA